MLKLLLLLSVVLFPSRQVLATEIEDLFIPKVYSDSKLGSIPYRLYLPPGYSTAKRYPLVVYLHGAGERGSNNLRQLKSSSELIERFVADSSQSSQNFFVLAPQCPFDKQWVEWDWKAGSYSTDTIAESEVLQLALGAANEVISTYPIDIEQVYVCGISMGGYGALDALVRHTDLFAAGIAVCGGGDTARASRLEDTPVWLFHGDADIEVPVKSSREMAMALEEVGAPFRYTEYMHQDHYAWTAVAKEPDLIPWLLSQRKEKASVASQMPTERIRIGMHGHSVILNGESFSEGYLRVYDQIGRLIWSGHVDHNSQITVRSSMQLWYSFTSSDFDQNGVISRYW